MVDKGVLLVDGYNIINQWPALKALMKGNMGAARNKLLDILEEYSPHPWAYIIVVFDAHRVPGGTVNTVSHGRVRVAYTGEGQTADAFIERLAADISGRMRVDVATSDWEEQRSVFMHGAIRISARELEIRLREEKRAFQDAYARMDRGRGCLHENLPQEQRERLETMRRQKKT